MNAKQARAIRNGIRLARVWHHGYREPWPTLNTFNPSIGLSYITADALTLRAFERTITKRNPKP